MIACHEALIAKGIDPHSQAAEVRRYLPLLPKVRRAGNRKLTDDQVLEIRREYQRGVVGYKALAKRYGVSDWTIRCVLGHMTYQDVTDETEAA